MERDHRFETYDLLDDLHGRLRVSGAAAVLRVLLWRSNPDLARAQALYGVAFDATVAWQALEAEPENEWRAGAEQALWLRRLIEHLAILVCFEERDERMDYWLWISLNERHYAERLIGGLSEEVSAALAPDQLRPFLSSPRDFADLPERAVTAFRGSSSGPPWFLSKTRWRQLLEGDVDSLDGWKPPSMREVLTRARQRADPFEVSIMGQYHLTYGRYSSHIHARSTGDPTAWPLFETEILWLTIVAVIHRLAALTGHRQAEAQRLAARLIIEMSDRFRFDGPPKVGEVVYPIGHDRMEVVEVAENATVAVVRREDGQVEIRRSVELLRKPGEPVQVPSE